MMTNFDKTREIAMKLHDQAGTPEMAKEFIVKMIADERSLACLINLVGIMVNISPVFAGLLKRSIMENTLTAMLYQFAEDLGINLNEGEEKN
jgi:hypothetical protein